MLSLPVDMTKRSFGQDVLQDVGTEDRKKTASRIRHSRNQPDGSEYLLDLNETMIWDSCEFRGEERPDGEKPCAAVRMVKLGGAHLRGIDNIAACSRLRICIMHKNYITRFDALINCPELIKLDLHSNQISVLPGGHFWQSLTQLKILLLHNNALGHLSCLQSLAATRSLEALTLYDTPLSLKKGYRHHVVNSVWSLKALDRYIISDEEIIEDAKLGGIYSAMFSAFHVDLNPPSRKSSGYREELANTHRVIAKISQVLARHSPVVIIQRVARGWLSRKKTQALFDNRIWASVVIQRFFRDHRRPLKQHPLVSPGPPPASPELRPAMEDRLPPIGDEVSLRIDYDSYMNNRRPGSTREEEDDDEDDDDDFEEPIDIVRELNRPDGGTSMMSDRQTPRAPPSTARNHTHTQGLISPMAASTRSKHSRHGSHQSLSQLMQLLYSDDLQPRERKLRTGLQHTMSSRALVESKEAAENNLLKQAEQKAKKKEFRTVKQMLGELGDLDQYSESQPDFTPVKFRLQGLKPTLHDVDPVHEMLVSKREAGGDIRAAYGQQKELIAEVAGVPKVTRRKIPNSDQKLFARVQGTMGMSCLLAVQKAYRDRATMERAAEGTEQVAGMKLRREQGKANAQTFLEERRQSAGRQRAKQSRAVADELDRQELVLAQELEKVKRSRDRTWGFQKACRTQLQFVTNFKGQSTSVSTALKRHDRAARQEDQLQGKQETVDRLQKGSQEQNQLVRRYLEHRQLMRQAQTTMDKVKLETRYLQGIKDRLLEAKVRVEEQKRQKKAMKAYYPLPQHSSKANSSQQQSLRSKGRWDSLVKNGDGRVGQHPTTFV